MDRTSMAFSARWPGQIIFGAGQVAALAREAPTLGRHACLCTTADLVALGVAGRIEQLLREGGLAVTCYDQVQPDPTCLAVDAAAERARVAGCDLVVGLGGGSAIDLAKGVAVAATHPGPVWEYVTYTGANAHPVTAAVLPVLAIPTTAGTGSEVSLGTVLDNPETHMKAALLSPHIFPRLALVDPELTYTMPPRITAMTGFDALTHGLEAYLNAVRANPASDIFALEAARLVAAYLPRVMADPDDRDARAAMSWAATTGGMAIALANTTVAHAMALPLAARLGVPHGLGLARLLPVVLAHSWPAQPARYARLAGQVGAAPAGMPEVEGAQALASWLAGFARGLGLHKAWQDWLAAAHVVVDEALLDTLAADVFAYMGRPVQQHQPVFTQPEVRQLFAEALRA